MDKPSAWADAEVQQAITLGLVPKELQSGYQKDITRGEFAEIVLCFLAAQYNYNPGDSFMNTLGHFLVYSYSLDPSKGNYLVSLPDTFTDNDVYISPEVSWAAFLGIVEGRGDGTFGPNDPITRQEAAAMLARAYGQLCPEKTMVLPKDVSSAPFSDQEAIADWALDSVQAVQSLGVMKGMGNGSFAPDKHYTREQCYVTFLRLWENAPVSRKNGNVVPFVSYEDQLFAILHYGEFVGYGTDVRFQAETDICTVAITNLMGTPHETRDAISMIYKSGGVRHAWSADSSNGFSSLRHYYHAALDDSKEYLLVDSDPLTGGTRYAVRLSDGFTTLAAEQ